VAWPKRAEAYRFAADKATQPCRVTVCEQRGVGSWQDGEHQESDSVSGVRGGVDQGAQASTCHSYRRRQGRRQLRTTHTIRDAILTCARKPAGVGL